MMRLKVLVMMVGLLTSPVLVGGAGEGDAEAILAIHKALITSHLEHDVDAVLEAEPDSIIVVNRGEVRYQRRSERVEQYKSYLEHADFAEYRDLIEPIAVAKEPIT